MCNDAGLLEAAHRIADARWLGRGAQRESVARCAKEAKRTTASALATHNHCRRRETNQILGASRRVRRVCSLNLITFVCAEHRNERHTRLRLARAAANERARAALRLH